MERTFTISEVVKTSWIYLKQQIWVLVGLFIGLTILSFLIGSMASPTSVGMMVVVNLLSTVISCLFMLGYYKNIFQTIDGLEPQFSAYGQQAPKILTCFITSIIIGIIVFIGICLLIVPGFYLALRLQFAFCFIVEENAGIVDSMTRSWDITKGHEMKLFLLLLAQIAMVIVGMLLLVVGIFVAAPLIYMTQCYVFRLLNDPLSVAEKVA